MQEQNEKIVVARLTATKHDGGLIIVEIYAGASFHNFYHHYTQAGKKRSTKKWLRTANRNEGLPNASAYRRQPGLEVLAAQFKANPLFSSIKIRIIKRRAYQQLITMAADQLGLSRVTPYTPPRRTRWEIQLPEPKRRYSILESRR